MNPKLKAHKFSIGFNLSFPCSLAFGSMRIAKNNPAHKPSLII
jgi:hypothetical protein